MAPRDARRMTTLRWQIGWKFRYSWDLQVPFRPCACPVRENGWSCPQVEAAPSWRSKRGCVVVEELIALVASGSGLGSRQRRSWSRSSVLSWQSCCRVLGRVHPTVGLGRDHLIYRPGGVSG